MTNNTGTFLAGMLIGGVSGAAAALLMAPRSGEETRSQIAEKTTDIADQAVERVNGVKQRAQTQAKATVDDLAERTSGVLRSASKQIEQLEKEIAKS